MSALINSFPGTSQPTQVAVVGPCPHKRLGAFPRNPMTLAESRVR
jgi:hypothetical protein